MGWSGGDEVFDPVADALIEAQVDDAVIFKVLTTLISKLQGRDWDTEEESLSRYQNNPAVVAAFYDCGAGNRLETASDDRVFGWLDTQRDPWAWTLDCKGRDGCGSLVSRVWLGALDVIAEMHNQLLRAWAAHDAFVHHGEGPEVDSWRLMRTGK